MSVRIISKSQQASGAFNGGQIVENKPIGFPREGGFIRPYSNLFYWARAEAVIDSTIGQHPHQGFEIMSFVLEGRIKHFDNQMNAWKPLETGDVQIIRAGNGIEHAEHMEKGAVMFQIWTDPNLGMSLQKPASYDDYRQEDFPVSEENGVEKTTLIGNGSPLTLDTQPLHVERLKMSGHASVENSEGEILSMYVISGSGQLSGKTVEEDDFIIIDEKGSFEFEPHDSLDVFVIKSPVELPYKTYAERMVAAN